MIIKAEDHLKHYGTPRHSGRYPWGSGGNATTGATRNRDFLDSVQHLRRQGMTNTEIAKGMGITTTQLRARISIAGTHEKQAKVNQIQRLQDKGWSDSAIGRHMGINESSVRSLTAPGRQDKLNVLESTSKMLKDQIDQHKYLDVGRGTENLIGVNRTKLDTAIAMLQEEGYKLHYLKDPQATTAHDTTSKILTKGNVTYSEVASNREKIASVSTHSDDGGRSFPKENELRPPINVSSRRVGINYAEDGGSNKDGVIFIKPGAKDLSLGAANYAQVRIAVDGTHYIKGMAVYNHDMPKDGPDIVFNTNKSNTGRKKDALKEMDTDEHGNLLNPLNPFGAEIKRQRGAFNIINEEGDWSTWSKNLSSQVLSKQKPALAKQQLNMTYERRQTELEDIMRLTNPTVRKKLLEAFADSADAASVHLKAAALPGQATKVILPLNSIKPTEIYAPHLENGTRVALIRFPHAGTFEIPQLRVNNKNAEAKKIMGTHAEDAVGIHPQTAHHLSGADFDGDFVLVIPNDKGSIESSAALKGLKDFDPQRAFPAYDGMHTIDGGVYNAKTKKVEYGDRRPSSRGKGSEMGKVTNLIADMSIRGADSEEMTRAVKHSMVVIDSEKHVLDYKGSFAANNIGQLKEKYQGIPTNAPRPKQAGASTLITRASARADVPKRKARPASEGGPVDPVTGKKVYVPTGESYVNRAGKTVIKTQRSKRLAEVTDAAKLSSGTPIEQVYVEHSNKLKAMANEARKEAVNTKGIKYSPSAKAAYSNEVASLNAKLNTAKKNAPLERQAQRIAQNTITLKRQANPDMDDDTRKKISNQAIAEARVRTGAHKTRIQPTQSEWDAIQAGAISNHKLTQILDNSDMETVKKLATPRVDKLMTATKKSRAVAMFNLGYTQAEVAKQLGVSLSTLKLSISE